MRQHSAVCNELFLSTPSARRATAPRAPLNAFQNISIHALREEGDVRADQIRKATKEFLSTLSARRATGQEQPFFQGVAKFLSTPSARRATQGFKFFRGHAVISIHALREEGDCCPRRNSCRPEPISIHALREEGDTAAAEVLAAPTISIHALREEGDQPHLHCSAHFPNFYPRPPRGGRPGGIRRRHGNWRISIHALREEGDLFPPECVAARKRFLSTPSARRATPPPTANKGAQSIFLSTPSARRATSRFQYQLNGST